MNALTLDDAARLNIWRVEIVTATNATNLTVRCVDSGQTYGLANNQRLGTLLGLYIHKHGGSAIGLVLDRLPSSGRSRHQWRWAIAEHQPEGELL